jgi:glycosyltransferase involved in cell wall biosynthesis
MRLRKVLFFNPDFVGHQFEFVQHVITHSDFNKSGIEPVFALNEQLISNLVLPSDFKGLFVPLTKEICDTWAGQPILSRANAKTQWIGEYASANKIDDVFLFSLDEFTISIWRIGRRYQNLKWSGILFGPYAAIPNRIALWSKKIRKIALTYLLWSSRHFKNLYILNSEVATKSYNKLPFLKGNKAVMLMDPVNMIGFDQEGHYEQLGLEPFKILVTGYITERKGVQFILQALESMPKEKRLQYQLTLAGYCDDAFKLKYSDRLAALSDCVVVIDEFLSQTDLHLIISKANLVSILYQDFYYSSGVLGLAALHNKPVLAFDSGVIAELVKTYQLGTVIRNDQPSELAKALELVKHHYTQLQSIMKANQYTSERTGQVFAETILFHIAKQD